MGDIIINGTVVRVGQVWEDSEGQAHVVHDVNGCVPDYPIETQSHSWAKNGWEYEYMGGKIECLHLVRCIEKGGKPYPAPVHIPAISPSKDHHYFDCATYTNCALSSPDFAKQIISRIPATTFTAETYTLEQLRDHHARIAEQLSQEICGKHVATMKKAARLGVK